MTRRCFVLLIVVVVTLLSAGSVTTGGSISASAAEGGFDASIEVVPSADSGAQPALAQVDAPTDDATESQVESGDGTKPLRVLAVLLGLLALLLGALTRWYWKATTPEARRGYLPEEPLGESIGEYGDGHGSTT